MSEKLRRRRASDRTWLVAAMMIVWLGAMWGCSATSRTSAGQDDDTINKLISQPRLELTVLIVGVDAERAGEADKFRRLREYAGVDMPREGRRWARSWEEITGLVGSLRAMVAVSVLTQPSMVIRSGSTATVRMQGASRTTMSVSLGAVQRPSGAASVDVGVRFDGDERDNRFEDLEFRGGGLRFMDERLLADEARIEGTEMQLSTGQITSPAGMRMFVFVSARAVTDTG